MLRFRKMIAKKGTRQWFFEKYIGDTFGKHIMNLGCETVDILDHFYDEKIYVGFYSRTEIKPMSGDIT